MSDDQRLDVVLATAINLANEAATGELMTALHSAGLRAIVLKGPPLQKWLFGEMIPRWTSIFSHAGIIPPSSSKS